MSIYVTCIHYTLPTTILNCLPTQHGLQSVLQYNMANVGGKKIYPLFATIIYYFDAQLDHRMSVKVH